jgi:hypothetical protein
VSAAILTNVEVMDAVEEFRNNLGNARLLREPIDLHLTEI